MKEYWRAKFRLPHDETRWAWVTEVNATTYDREGEELFVTTYQVVNRFGEAQDEIIVASDDDTLVLKPCDMNLKYVGLEFAPICSECTAGEHYNERAVAKVRHPNCDSYNHSPPITKNVCEDHEHMLATDYGDDLQILEVFQGGK